MRAQLIHHLSETASYENCVAQDCLFSILKDDKLLSNNTVNVDVQKEENNIQISDEILKLMERIHGCIAFEIGW